MIRAGTGLSTQADHLRAASEAAGAAMARLGEGAGRGPAEADALLVFISGWRSSDLVPMLDSIRSICGTANLAGCSGSGVITESAEVEGSPGVAILAIASDTLQATSLHARDLKGKDREVGRELGRIAEPLLGDNPILLIFPDTLCCNPEALLSGIRDVIGPVPVVGGGAAPGGSAGKVTHQFCGGAALTNAVSGMVLTGRIVSSVGVTQSCLPVGRPLRVTRSQGNAIRTLDGAPAVRALLECLTGGPGHDLSVDAQRLASHLFLAFPSRGATEIPRGQYLVRNILGVDPEDGAIFVGQEMHEGDLVSFALRDPDGAREDLKAMIEESVPIAGRPDMGLYFNCCARGKGLYGLAGIDTAFISNAFAGVPLAGFFGLAEIAPVRGQARLHNYAGVMVLVSEAPES
ncbi:MAG TPA: FIST N-terminal domain-containing protein [Candidatus Polarisedimenticolia bacterium]|jgi:small ligand-binding sensory domain FIST